MSRAIRRDLHKALRGISAKHTLAAAAQFAHVTQPVLLAWAPEDRLFKLAFAQRLQSAFHDARIECIRDAYTFSPEDQPQQLATRIEAFVHETSGIHAA